jgi:broad specificity phosphatase PhoE
MEGTRPLAALQSSGTGARVWLCRHAQVHADFRTLAYGDRDVPLSPEGIGQTAALWEAFAAEAIDHVQASSLERALALGRGIAERTGASLEVDPRLIEIDRGQWTMIERDLFQQRWAAEAREYHADTYSWNGYGGESDLDLFERVEPAFREAVARVAGGTVFLAVHFNVIRVLLSRLLGVAPQNSFLLPIQTAHATLLIDDPDGWRVVQENVNAPPSIVS